MRGRGGLGVGLAVGGVEAVRAGQGAMGLDLDLDLGVGFGFGDGGVVGRAWLLGGVWLGGVGEGASELVPGTFFGASSPLGDELFVGAFALADAVFAEVFDACGDAFEAAEVALEDAGAMAFGFEEGGQPIDPDVHVVDVAERGLEFPGVLDGLFEGVGVEGLEQFHGVAEAFGGDAELVELFGEVGLAGDGVVGEHFLERAFDPGPGEVLEGGVVGSAAVHAGLDGQAVQFVGHLSEDGGVFEAVEFLDDAGLVGLALLEESESESAQSCAELGGGGCFEDAIEPFDLDVEVADLAEGLGEAFGVLSPASGGLGGEDVVESAEGGA